MNIPNEELRVGNNVIVNGKIITVDTNTLVYNEKHGTLRPIELSSEVLLKLGFEFVSNRSNKPIFYGHSFHIERVSDGWAIEFEWTITIKYVHNLQNLVHAMTGEETLKLKYDTRR